MRISDWSSDVCSSDLAGLGRELRQDLLGDQPRVALDADAHLLGEADAVRVDVDLDDRRLLRPVVDAVARQRREGIEPRAQRQHHVSPRDRSEEHTSELQSLMRISYAVFCLKKKKINDQNIT